MDEDGFVGRPKPPADGESVWSRSPDAAPMADKAQTRLCLHHTALAAHAAGAVGGDELCCMRWKRSTCCAVEGLSRS